MLLFIKSSRGVAVPRAIATDGAGLRILVSVCILQEYFFFLFHFAMCGVWTNLDCFAGVLFLFAWDIYVLFRRRHEWRRGGGTAGNPAPKTEHRWQRMSKSPNNGFGCARDMVVHNIGVTQNAKLSRLILFVDTI